VERKQTRVTPGRQRFYRAEHVGSLSERTFTGTALSATPGLHRTRSYLVPAHSCGLELLALVGRRHRKRPGQGRDHACNTYARRSAQVDSQVSGEMAFHSKPLAAAVDLAAVGLVPRVRAQMNGKIAFLSKPLAAAVDLAAVGLLPRVRAQVFGESAFLSKPLTAAVHLAAVGLLPRVRAQMKRL
jgi:hypothetical protein